MKEIWSIQPYRNSFQSLILCGCSTMHKPKYFLLFLHNIVEKINFTFPSVFLTSVSFCFCQTRNCWSGLGPVGRTYRRKWQRDPMQQTDRWSKGPGSHWQRLTVWSASLPLIKVWTCCMWLLCNVSVFILIYSVEIIIILVPNAPPAGISKCRS